MFGRVLNATSKIGGAAVIVGAAVEFFIYDGELFFPFGICFIQHHLIQY